VQASSDHQPLRDVARPGRIAEKLIDLVAPTVRELRRRSAPTGELILKRELGGGRREEIFLRRVELTSQWAALGPGRRTLFDAWGLGDGVVIAPVRDVRGAVVKGDFEAEDTTVETREYVSRPHHRAMA
jgi:hypothetical protein